MSWYTRLQRQERIFYSLMSCSIVLCLFTFCVSFVHCFTMAATVISVLLLTLDLSAVLIRLMRLKVKVYWLCGMEINGENISFCGYKEEYLKNSSIDSHTEDSDSFHYQHRGHLGRFPRSNYPEYHSEDANRSTSETGGENGG